MGDYVCLHGMVPRNELPKKLRGKIPKHEIWIREDVYSNKKRRNAVLRHERIELKAMIEKERTYKQAHRKAQREESRARWRNPPI